MDVISGNELKSAHKNQNAGQSPPRQGPSTRIPREDFKYLCQLVFTSTSIEQGNCTVNRMTRGDLVAAIGEIVNAKLVDMEDDVLNATKFYGRIEAELARDCSLTTADTRELLRATWLTYQNQNKHYEYWERQLVDLGFGQYASNHEERLKHGNVVLYDGMAKRIIQCDEMGFSLDGSKNGVGGRESATPTNPNLPEAGKPTNKSSQKSSWMFGMNFDDEPLPPMVVLPSAAEIPKFKVHFVTEMPQVEGVFGFPGARFFAPVFAASENASFDNKLFLQWINEILVPLFPDAEDKAGYRVLLKSDSGPGRFSVEFRSVARSHGVYFFPGPPNGTELGQEMDQLYSLLKTLMEKNRKLIFEARFRLHGKRAKTDVWDLPRILFGGEIHFEDGTSIVLPDCFKKGLSREKCERARKKCGYLPATREALKSPKLRHEVFYGEDGGVDVEADPYGEMLQELERQNHTAVDWLIEKGYTSWRLI